MMSTAEPARLWVPEEAAKYLGVPLSTFYRWRVSGKGPKAMKIGKYLRYSPDVVRQWAEDQADDRRGGAA